MGRGHRLPGGDRGLGECSGMSLGIDRLTTRLADGVAVGCAGCAASSLAAVRRPCPSVHLGWHVPYKATICAGRSGHRPERELRSLIPIRPCPRTPSIRPDRRHLTGSCIAQCAGRNDPTPPKRASESLSRARVGSHEPLAHPGGQPQRQRSSEGVPPWASVRECRLEPGSAFWIGQYW